jgi:hypothetical protein
MAIRDRWVERFKCPACGSICSANLSCVDGQESKALHADYLIVIDSLPENFKVAGKPQDIDVFCIKCNVSAWP